VLYDGFLLFTVGDPNNLIFQIHTKLGLGQGCRVSTQLLTTEAGSLIGKETL